MISIVLISSIVWLHYYCFSWASRETYADCATYYLQSSLTSDPSHCYPFTAKSKHGRPFHMWLESNDDQRSNQIRWWGRWALCDSLEERFLDRGGQSFLQIGGNLGECALMLAEYGMTVDLHGSHQCLDQLLQLTSHNINLHDDAISEEFFHMVMIDAGGAECQILCEASEAISSGAWEYLKIAIDDAKLQKNGCSGEKLRRMLRVAGFREKLPKTFTDVFSIYREYEWWPAHKKESIC